jgi:hypothetical protein
MNSDQPLSVYVGTSLFNAQRAKQIIAKFLAANIPISYDWTTHGQASGQDDLAKYGKLEEEGVRECSLFFMIQPGRSGTHCEFGMAYAWGKPIIILEDVEVEQKTFYYRPNIFRFKTEEEAFTKALQILEAKTRLL